MKYIEHCKECKEKLGKDWSCVHRWLDEFAKPGNLNFHRVYRHHDSGIEEVRKKWGDEAFEAARLHVIADYGYVPTEEESDRMYKVDKRD